MTPTLIRALTIAASVGSGLVAGTFFAFSTFVMRALGRIPVPQGIAAMQSINVTVLNPFFMIAFFGTAALSLGICVFAFPRWHEPASTLLIVASLLYVIGTFGVTVVGNVPLNDVLAAVTPENGGEVWTRYLRVWTYWNHVRTIAAALAMLLFILAAIRIGGAQGGGDGAELPTRGVR